MNVGQPRVNKFKIALGVKCPKCGSESGAPCISTSGFRKGTQTSTLHNERLREVKNVTGVKS